MGNADKLKVSYDEFLLLCRVQDRENWLPGLRVGIDGVWVKDDPNPLLDGAERAELSRHPDGDPSKPVLTFPCTLGELCERLWYFNGGGFIDPLDLAEFVAKSTQLAGSDQAMRRWPWGNHHTKSLGHLEAAAKKFWQRYDPTDATTAPTNEVVAKWLIEERGLSERRATAIASMLHADDLAAGPRK